MAAMLRRGHCAASAVDVAQQVQCRCRAQVQQRGDVAHVVGQRRRCPSLARCGGPDAARAAHCAPAPMVGVAIVADPHQQFGQSPGAHQTLLQVVQLDVQHFDAARPPSAAPGRRVAARRCAAPAPARSATATFRRSRAAAPPHGSLARRGPCGAPRRPARTRHPDARARSTACRPSSASGWPASRVLDGIQRTEGTKERPDTEHHQRGGDGFRVGRRSRRTHLRHVCQQLQRHQRVGADRLGEQVRVDFVLVGAQFVDARTQSARAPESVLRRSAPSRRARSRNGAVRAGGTGAFIGGGRRTALPRLSVVAAAS